MTQLSKNLVCIQMRSGVEIWAEKERVENLQNVLKDLKNHIFVNYDGQTINTADLVGIFEARTMEEHTLRKNGNWKCDKSNWHQKRDMCNCLTKEQIENQEKQRLNYINKYGAEPLP